jgi:hypothetical protein
MNHVERLVELWVTPNFAEVRRELKSREKFEALIRFRDKNSLAASNTSEPKPRQD